MAKIRSEQLSKGIYSITGSIYGSASFADKSISSSYAVTASYFREQDPIFIAVSGSLVTTSSFNSFTASYTTGSFTGSFGGNGSGLTHLRLPLTESKIYVGNASDIAQGIDLYGDIAISSSGITTIQPHSVTYGKMQTVSTSSILGSLNPSGGDVEEIPTVEAYLTYGTTTTNLDSTANWDGTGNYIGPTITNTFQGQAHYNSFYWFTAVDNDVWIRLVRG
jgi:hypothetical protein